MLTRENIRTISRLANYLLRDLEADLPASDRASARSLVIAAMPSIVTEVARTRSTQRPS